jgi:hypothetical protein
MDVAWKVKGVLLDRHTALKFLPVAVLKGAQAKVVVRFARETQAGSALTPDVVLNWSEELKRLGLVGPE